MTEENNNQNINNINVLVENTLVEDTNEKEPIFYILMRNDISSLNAGKAIAQGSHAMQAFADIAEHNENIIFPTDIKEEFINLYYTWKQSTAQNYGTVVVLSVNKLQLDNIIGNVAYECRDEAVLADTITDPTYPFIVENKEIAKLLTDNSENIFIESFMDDGKVLMCRSENTCGYIFCDKDNPKVKAQLEYLELY